MTMSTDLPQMLKTLHEPRPDTTTDDMTMVLFAAVVRTEHPFGFKGYSKLQHVCRKFWGEQALHAFFQAKLHYALLHPLDGAALESLAMQLAEKKTTQERMRMREVLYTLLGIEDNKTPLNELPQVCLPVLQAFEDADQDDIVDYTKKLTSLCWRALTKLTFLETLAEQNTDAQTALPCEKNTTPLAELQTMAAALNDTVLYNEVQRVQALFREQAITLVVVGERKRGKSTVFNLLAGEIISPMREGIAETASLIQVQHRERLKGTAIYMPAETLQNIARALENDPLNPVLQNRHTAMQRAINKEGFTPSARKPLTLYKDISRSIQELFAFENPYSGVLERIEIELPLKLPIDNMVLLDTPGLNHTDPLLAEQALQGALTADIVVFVTDARDACSQSELELLRRLTQTGRAISVLGVLTNIDRLESLETVEHVKEQTLMMLREACREASTVHIEGLIAVNAKEALAHKQNTQTNNAAEADNIVHEQFFTLIQEALQREATMGLRNKKAQEAMHAIIEQASVHLDRHMKKRLQDMPDASLLYVFENQARQLTKVTERSLERARQVAELAQADIDAWMTSMERDIQRFHETLVLRLMEAIQQHTMQLGRSFSRSSSWEEFEQVTIPNVAKGVVNDFLEDQRRILQSFEEKLRIFSAELAECAQNCLTAASDTLVDLDHDFFKPMHLQANAATHYLIQTRHYMAGLAVFAGGAALGHASIFTPLALLASIGNIVALIVGSPVLAAALTAVIGTAGAVYHFGDEDKQRNAFLQRRQKEAESYADHIVQALRGELTTARQSIAELYAEEVRTGFMPTLESLFFQAIHQRGFVEVMRRMQEDNEHFRVAGQEHLQDLQHRCLVG